MWNFYGRENKANMCWTYVSANYRYANQGHYEILFDIQLAKINKSGNTKRYGAKLLKQEEPLKILSSNVPSDSADLH